MLFIADLPHYDYNNDSKPENKGALETEDDFKNFLE